MEPSPTGRPRSRLFLAFAAVGVAIALAPRGWLTVITDVPWQQSMISMTALAGAVLASGLPWALAAGGRLAQRAYAWAAIFTITGTIYVVSLSPTALIVAFMTGFAGSLDVWMARAEIASTSLRDRLNDGDRRSAT